MSIYLQEKIVIRKQIVKKNLIDKIIEKVAKYIKYTELLVRS